MKTYMVLFFLAGRIEVLDNGDANCTPFVTHDRDEAHLAASATREVFGCRAIVVRVGAVDARRAA